MLTPNNGASLVPRFHTNPAAAMAVTLPTHINTGTTTRQPLRLKFSRVSNAALKCNTGIAAAMDRTLKRQPYMKMIWPPAHHRTNLNMHKLHYHRLALRDS